MTPAFVPVLQVFVVGAVIFALMAIGAAMTYRLAWREGDRHSAAMLLGAKVYVSVAALMVLTAMAIGVWQP